MTQEQMARIEMGEVGFFVSIATLFVTVTSLGRYFDGTRDLLSGTVILVGLIQTGYLVARWRSLRRARQRDADWEKSEAKHRAKSN